MLGWICWIRFWHIWRCFKKGAVAKVAQKYLDGKGSFYYLADKYYIGRATIQKWVAAYKIHGLDVFICGYGNASYTSEFKTMCVEEVISDYDSSRI